MHPRILGLAGTVAVTALLIAMPGAGAAGQVVRGRLVDAIRGAAIAGALVELRDSTGTVRARTFSSDAGAFALMPPTRSGLVLRVIAIGYAPRPLQPVVGTSLGDIAMTPHAVALPAIRALAEGKGCRSVGNADTYARLLDAAGAALEVMEATIASGSRQFEVIEIHRTLVNGQVTKADSSSGLLTEWPIASIDHDSLRSFGFAAATTGDHDEGRMWYGPDLAVLFSDWFQATHCFSVARAGKQDTDIVIKYEPLKKSGIVDLEGEIRLDPATLAVRELNYTHVHLPTGILKGLAGGVVRFASDGSGTWVPVYWSIRAPMELRPPRGITAAARTQAGRRGTVRMGNGYVERVGRVVGGRVPPDVKVVPA